jgi:DNA-binding transcriptional LysR family regulator
MDRLESLVAFTQVSDLGGFAPAARAMRVSPTAITRAIAGLEARLGVALLHRTTRSVRLTEEGALFLPRARQVLADLKEAESLVMGAQAEPQGTLVVTAPVVFGRTHGVPIVAELLRRHPRLTVQLLLLDRNVQMVEEGIDIAIRIGELADSSLHAVRLGEVRRVLVASPGYLKAHGRPVKVADLRRHAIVAFTGISPSDEWRFGADGKSTVRIQPRLVLNNADAGIAAVKLGLGIGRFLSYQVAEDIAAGKLRTLLDDATPVPAPVHLLFHASRSASPKVRSFIDAAKKHLRGAPL